jgi:hypothetical protein
MTSTTLKHVGVRRVPVLFGIGRWHGHTCDRYQPSRPYYWSVTIRSRYQPCWTGTVDTNLTIEELVYTYGLLTLSTFWLVYVIFNFKKSKNSKKSCNPSYKKGKSVWTHSHISAFKFLYRLKFLTPRFIRVHYCCDASISDIDMTEDEMIELLHQTIVDETTKLTSQSSTRRRRRTQHRSYIERDWSYPRSIDARLL